MAIRGLERAELKLHGHWNKYLSSWFTADDPTSDCALSVMIPLAPKDVVRAGRSIAMLRENIAHPIDEIVVAAPDHGEIRALCDRAEVTFVDERAPLSRLIGKDRLEGVHGWHRQQILKLAAPEVTGAPRVLAIDSDTYPARPTSFVTQDGRPVFYMATRDQSPFEAFTRRLIGRVERLRTSFVAHCMLFEAPALASLYEAIENHCRQPWIDAVLSHVARPIGEVGLMSEFDLYGQHLLQTAPADIAMRPFSNLKVSMEQFLGEAALPWWNRRFRFLSNHEHLS